LPLPDHGYLQACRTTGQIETCRKEMQFADRRLRFMLDNILAVVKLGPAM
jgi:hypothetical protein